jgi:hypothetical protein
LGFSSLGNSGNEAESRGNKQSAHCGSPWHRGTKTIRFAALLVTLCAII